MNSLQGHLLLASPHLPDPNFFRSVVLICQHDEEGAFGLLLNRPSSHTIEEIWNRVSDLPCVSHQPVRLGGPIDGPLMALHTQETFSENQVLPSVFIATQRDNLEQIVTQDEHPFRLFSGYSGWGKGQLENELQLGGWITKPAAFDDVFYQGEDELWKKLTSTVGGDILREALRIKDVPDDPSVN